MNIGLYAGDFTGSGKAVVFPLSRGLAKRGHEVSILRLNRYPSRSKSVDGNVTLCSESTVRAVLTKPFSSVSTVIARSSFGSNSDSGLTPYNAIHGRAIREFVTRNELDIVYLFHNRIAAAYLSELGADSAPTDTKVVINLIGFGIDKKRGGERSTFQYQDYLFAHPKWHAHITATRFEATQYESVYERLSLNPNRVFHIPHSIDSETFNVENARSTETLMLPDASLLMTYPVHVYPRKNIELGMKVLAELVEEDSVPNPRLVVTGELWDEGYYDRLDELATDLDIHDSVTFLGGIPYSRMPELLYRSDLVVFPSHQETFGIGIVEALACGTPVVGPDYIHATKEVLESILGGFAAEKSVDAFCEKILGAVESAPPSTEISRQALAKYGNDTVAEEFETMVTSEIVSEPPTERPTSENMGNIQWAGLYEDNRSYDVKD